MNDYDLPSFIPLKAYATERIRLTVDETQETITIQLNDKTDPPLALTFDEYKDLLRIAKICIDLPANDHA